MRAPLPRLQKLLARRSAPDAGSALLGACHYLRLPSARDLHVGIADLALPLRGHLADSDVQVDDLLAWSGHGHGSATSFEHSPDSQGARYDLARRS